MPPRFVYWTILIDGKPTAFRARDKEELLPTVAQLKRTNQDVIVKWFARGKLWDSPEAELAAQYAPVRPVEKRNRDWRPGGTHQDPRDRFKKKNRPERAWSEEERDRDRARRPKPAGEGRPPRRSPDTRSSGGGGWANKPAGPPQGDRRPWQPKPSGPPHGANRPPRNDRPWQTKPTGPRADRKPWRPKPAGAPRDDNRPPRRSPNARPSGGGGWQHKPSGRPRDQQPRSPRGASGEGAFPKKKRNDDPDKG